MFRLSSLKARIVTVCILRRFRVIRMNIVAVAVNFFCLISSEVLVEGWNFRNLENNTDSYLNTIQIIRKYGYPAEAHVIETVDGYLLTMHRIPNGKQGVTDNCNSRRYPIFMLHGFCGSSADFTLIGSNSLALLLADLGYDVWLGNVRGNRYSRAHAQLYPNERKFWNFTWHQSAIYDAPAQIDYICNYTKKPKLIYIGFSMGTTIFFAMTSTLPKYNDKIELSLLMAPVAYLKNIKSPLLRIFALFGDNVKVVDEFFEHGEFLPHSKLMNFLRKFICENNNSEKSYCLNLIFMLVGSDPEEFDKRLMPTMINHYPTGYSAKAVSHYSQLYKSGKFCQYDYGRRRNILEYGSPEPPNYNLSLIKVPMYFYVGKNDYVATLQDNKHLAKELSTLKKLHVIEYPKFSHMDFLASLDVKEFLYNLLIKDLTSFVGTKYDN